MIDIRLQPKRICAQSNTHTHSHTHTFTHTLKIRADCSSTNYSKLKLIYKYLSTKLSSFVNKINFKRIIKNKSNLPNQFLYKMLTSRFSQRVCLPPNFDTLEILFLSSKDYSSNSLQGWRQFPSHCLVVHRTPSFENIGVGVVFLVYVYYSRSALDSLTDISFMVT